MSAGRWDEPPETGDGEPALLARRRFGSIGACTRAQSSLLILTALAVRRPVVPGPGATPTATPDLAATRLRGLDVGPHGVGFVSRIGLDPTRRTNGSDEGTRLGLAIWYPASRTPGAPAITGLDYRLLAFAAPLSDAESGDLRDGRGLRGNGVAGTSASCRWTGLRRWRRSRRPASRSEARLVHRVGFPSSCPGRPVLSQHDGGNARVARLRGRGSVQIDRRIERDRHCVLHLVHREFCPRRGVGARRNSGRSRALMCRTSAPSGTEEAAFKR